MNGRMAAALLLALLMTTGLAGAAQAAGDGPAGALERQTIEITDGVGRVVRVPRNPDRVAAIFAPSAHIIAMLGDSGKIVAVSAGNMRDRLFLDFYPAVAKARTPTGGGGGGGLNAEELFSDPAPDVIFCNSGQIYDERIMEKIEKFGIPVVAVEFRTVEELKTTVRMVGDILGREEKARIYCTYIDETEQRIRGRLQGLQPHERRRVYHAVNELLRTAAINSVPGDWITRLGIDLVGAVEVREVNDSKNYISLETLFSYDPPYMLVTGADVYDHIRADEKLHVLTACKNGAVYLLPNGISRWAHQYSIEVAPAMLWVFKMIYPELFADIDLEAETRNFYREVFEVDLDEATVERILSGRDLRLLKSGADVERRGR